jgi:hypothetical protein
MARTPVVFSRRAPRAPRSLTVLCGTALAFLLAACGGGGGDPVGVGGPGPVTPPPTPTIAIAASSGSGSVAGSGEVSTTITLTRGGSYTGEVSLAAQGLPSGVSAAFAPSTLTGSTSSAVLTLTVTGAAAIGAVPVSIVATGTGVASATVPYQLTIAAAPDFTLSVATDTLRIPVGSSGTTSVRLQRSGGFSTPILLLREATTGPLIGAMLFDFARDTVVGSSAADTVPLTVSIGNTVAVGAYPITIRGKAAGNADRTAPLIVVVEPPPSAGSLRVSPRAVTTFAGQPSAPVTVVLERASGVTGPATLSIDNLPETISATFSNNPLTGDTSVLVLTPSPNQPQGGYSLRVRATIGAASAVDTLSFTTLLFVPPDFGITPSVPSIVVTAGASSPVDVRVARTGGFTGAVRVNLVGAPAGMTATLVPDSITGELGVLTIAAAGTIGEGTYPVTLEATGTGLSGTRTAALTVSVIAPASNNITWQFCDAARIPVWFATRTGATTGAWTRVMPTGAGTFTFSYPANGQVAYVQTGANGSLLQVYQLRPAEMFQQAVLECAEHPARKTVTGTIANVNFIQGMAVAMGGADTSVVQEPTGFALNGVADRTTDLLAVRGQYSVSGGYTLLLRSILRRNINPAAGSAIPLLDFDGPEWIGFGGSLGTLFNVAGDSVRTEMALLTSNGLVGTYFRDLTSRDSSRTFWGVLSSTRAASDLHRMTAYAAHTTMPRRVTGYANDYGAFYETRLGDRLSGVSVVLTGSAPVQTRVTGSWTTDYGFDVSTTYRQGTGAAARTVTYTSARAYFGAASTGYNMLLPDFSTAPGFDSAWMLQPGAPVSWEHWVSGLENGVTRAPLEGLLIRSGGMVGVFTP